MSNRHLRAELMVQLAYSVTMTDMGPSGQLDVGAVRAALKRMYPDVTGIAALTGGAWSQAFSFTSRGLDLVIRFGEYADDYEKDRRAGTWHQPGLPVPEILDIGEAGEYVYAISELVKGEPLEQLDGDGWRRVLPGLFDALEGMRAVQLPGEGYGGWQAGGIATHVTWRDWLLSVADTPTGSRTRGWRSKLAASPRAETRFYDGVAALHELAQACPELRHVVHGDLTAGNVLVEGEKITGIFDWGNSIAGDPLYDIAWLTFWAPWHSGTTGVNIRELAKERFDDDGFDERVRCYEVHIGLDSQQYNAYMGRWGMLEEVADRTLAIALR